MSNIERGPFEQWWIDLALNPGTPNWYTNDGQQAAKAAWQAARQAPASGEVEPVVEAYVLNRLHGTGYGAARKVVDARKYNPTLDSFWVAGAKERYEIIPLVHANTYSPAKVPEWVRCSERLPEAGQCVDVWGSIIGGYNHGDEFRLTDCFHDHDHKLWWKWDDKCERKVVIEGVGVTHWMPLPPQPMEDP